MEEKKQLTPELKQMILRFQANEITEYYVYTRLAKLAKNEKNKRTLEHIAQDEKRHSEIWRNYSQVEIRPKKLLLAFYTFLSKLLGITFAIKLMEKGEEKAQAGYQKIIDQFPETKQIFDEENRHEKELIEIIHEEKLNYLGSVVLGISDALVELTGALAGLSFALQNTRLIALAGLITGIAASMSMAASEYLSKKTEKESHPAKASLYTGIAYVVVVSLLVTPFLLATSYRHALPISLGIAILIVAAFTYFSATVQDQSFKKKFFEMASITLGVAFISFLVGMALRTFFNIDV